MIDKTFYVHAGGSKTGTSALQNFFDTNAPRLETCGFSYGNSIGLTNAYSINSGNGLSLCTKLLERNTPDDEIDGFVLSYFNGCNSAICSSESFELLSNEEWNRLLESSIRVGVKLEIFFYVRNVLPYFQSAYDQVIKRHGVSQSFDEWAVQSSQIDWQHVKALRAISAVVPKTNMHVLHYDREERHLIRKFLDDLGVDASFEIEQGDQERRVNRSLTNEEREALRRANEILGQGYSEELSDLLINANPEAQVFYARYDQQTVEILHERYKGDIDWLNEAFFGGKEAVSMLPIISDGDDLTERLAVAPSCNDGVDALILNWALNKLKTIRDETGARIFGVLMNAATTRNRLEAYPELPDDFDVVAYLLLNPDVLYAGVDPISHYIVHGKQEWRSYKFDVPQI